MPKSITAVLENLGRDLCPPLLWKGLTFLKARLIKKAGLYRRQTFSPHQQDLDIYWDAQMAQMLETWGEGNVWNEIQFLLVNCSGRVLDIACGTGKVMEILAKFPQLEIHGLDISDFLIQKALDRGILPERLKVCDATRTEYDDDFFNFAYSIGSLEHFTAEGIVQAFKEFHRIVKKVSFHLVPVSRSGQDEGWIKIYQSYYNNSVDWWLAKVRPIFSQVFVLDSSWHDDISLGKWIVCKKG